MTLCFLIYRYFPHGGQQRDFLRIALALQARGYRIRVYTLDWDADVPAGFDVRIVPARGLTRPRLYRRFHGHVAQALNTEPVAMVIGFSRMPGLDVYFGADPCFAEKARTQRGAYYPYTARYRHFIAYERAVFGEQSRTGILLLSELQKAQYLRHYPMADERIHLLPPGIGKDRFLPDNAAAQREEFRRQYGLSDEELLVLQVGSGFSVKGVDRSIRALAALPEVLRRKTHLFIVGQGRSRALQRLARRLRVSSNCQFLGGSDQVSRFMLGSDLMLHPAHSESGGLVLLEALVFGLPVITTDTCGHANQIETAGAGVVLSSPFSQPDLDNTLRQALQSAETLKKWHDNALQYSKVRDFHAMPEVAADYIEQHLRMTDTEKGADDTVPA